MLKHSLTTGLFAIACTLGLSAQEPVTLASWTFETGYTVTSIDDKNSLYTPTAGTTNWNMRNLSIDASEMEKPASVDNKNVTFTWPMGSITPSTTATASDAAFAEAAIRSANSSTFA